MSQKCYPELNPLLLKWAQRFSDSEAEQRLLVERTLRGVSSDEEIFLRRAVSRSLYRLMVRLAKTRHVPTSSDYGSLMNERHPGN